MILSILHPVTWNNMCQQKIEFQAAAASSSSSSFSPKPLLSSIVFESPEISVCWRRSHRSLHHHHGCYCSGPSLAAGWQNDRSNIKYVSRWTTSLLFNAIQAATTAAAEKIAKPWYQAHQPPPVSSVARSSRHYHRLSFAREEKNNSRCEEALTQEDEGASERNGTLSTCVQMVRKESAELDIVIRIYLFTPFFVFASSSSFFHHNPHSLEQGDGNNY